MVSKMKIINDSTLVAIKKSSFAVLFKKMVNKIKGKNTHVNKIYTWIV
jgi:hypothetical protein